MKQEVIVALIGLAVVAIIGRKLYRFFSGKTDRNGSCGCSDCHCNSTKR